MPITQQMLKDLFEPAILNEDNYLRSLGFVSKFKALFENYENSSNSEDIQSYDAETARVISEYFEASSVDCAAKISVLFNIMDASLDVSHELASTNDESQTLSVAEMVLTGKLFTRVFDLLAENLDKYSEEVQKLISERLEEENNFPFFETFYKRLAEAHTSVDLVSMIAPENLTIYHVAFCIDFYNKYIVNTLVDKDKKIKAFIWLIDLLAVSSPNLRESIELLAKKLLFENLDASDLRSQFAIEDLSTSLLKGCIYTLLSTQTNDSFAKSILENSVERSEEVADFIFSFALESRNAHILGFILPYHQQNQAKPFDLSAGDNFFIKLAFNENDLRLCELCLKDPRVIRSLKYEEVKVLLSRRGAFSKLIADYFILGDQSIDVMQINSLDPKSDVMKKIAAKIAGKRLIYRNLLSESAPYMRADSFESSMAGPNQVIEKMMQARGYIASCDKNNIVVSKDEMLKQLRGIILEYISPADQDSAKSDLQRFIDQHRISLVDGDMPIDISLFPGERNTYLDAWRWLATERIYPVEMMTKSDQDEFSEVAWELMPPYYNHSIVDMLRLAVTCLNDPSISDDDRQNIKLSLIQQLSISQTAHNPDNIAVDIDQPSCLSGTAGRLLLVFDSHPELRAKQHELVQIQMQKIINKIIFAEFDSIFNNQSLSSNDKREKLLFIAEATAGLGLDNFSTILAGRDALPATTGHVRTCLESAEYTDVITEDMILYRNNLFMQDPLFRNIEMLMDSILKELQSELKNDADIKLSDEDRAYISMMYHALMPGPEARSVVFAEYKKKIGLLDANEAESKMTHNINIALNKLQDSSKPYPVLDVRLLQNELVVYGRYHLNKIALLDPALKDQIALAFEDLLIDKIKEISQAESYGTYTVESLKLLVDSIVDKAIRNDSIGSVLSKSKRL